MYIILKGFGSKFHKMFETTNFTALGIVIFKNTFQQLILIYIYIDTGGQIPQKSDVRQMLHYI